MTSGQVAVRGIKTLDDARLRCRVDELTGCWLWSCACGKNGVPVMHLAAGVGGGDGRRQVAARRGAWLLAGKPMRPGQVVFLARDCDMRCINPAHCRAGKSGDAQRAAARRGAFSSPERRLHLHAIRQPQVLPPELVRRVAAEIACGMTAKRAAEVFDLNVDTTRRIRRGEHAHQRPALLPGASIFAQPPR